jgi:hypothetical protein
VANDKKFIVKNGLLTQETVVIGSTTDNGVNKLQVTGSSIFTQATGSTPTINITNSGGTSNSIIAQFTGDSDSLQVVNIGTGDYAILNSQQNNGIRFHDGTSGVEILYNGAVDIDFNSAGIDFKREPSYLGDVFWNAGNDGAGSGLDADLLDGLDSLQFLRSDQDDTFDGNLIITGNLTIQGTTTTINTETVLIADNIITLNSNFTGSTPTENAGIEVERGTLTNSSLVWDELNDWWKLISAGTDLGRIITTADEGSGNGFDADTVDGLQAAQFLRSDADDTATGNIIFQGTITVGNNTAAGALITMDGQAGNRYIFSNNGEIGFLNSAFAYAAYSDAANNWRVLNDTYAKRFIDADNNTYLLDPASTSVLNTIDLEGQIRHNGDTDTYIGFNAVDSFEVRTGGSQRLVVNNTSVTAAQDFVGPRFVDSNNNAFYADFAGSAGIAINFNGQALGSNGNSIAPTYSFTSDPNTGIYRSTAGTIAFSSNTINVFATGAGSGAYNISFLDLRAPRFIDSDNVSKFLDPGGLSQLTSANFYNGSTTANNEINIGRSATERFNINVTDGQGYISYIQDETDSTDHSVNFEIISSGIGLNRFNFNKNIDVGSNSVSGAFGVFSSGVYAPIFYDNDNELFYADFNNTGNSINMAGTIRGGNGSLAAPTYTFGSDTNTGMYRFGTDTIGFSAGGNDEFRILTTYALAVGQMRSPIFYDSNNTAYFGDFASTSNMNRIDIDDYIRHRGDTDTYFGFSAADTIVAVTANTTRLTINTTGVTSTLDVTAPNFYGARFYDSGNVAYYADPASASVFNTLGIDSDLFHNGDTDNKIQFTTDTQTFQTGGVTRLTINNTSVTSAVNVFAPQFYTNDYLIHNGDTNTYIGFDTNDRFGVWTAGVKRINVDTEVDLLVNTNVTGNLDVTGRATIGNSLTRPANLSILTNSAARIGGSDVHLHIASLSATGNFAVALQSGRQSDNASFPMALQPNGGNVGIGTLTAGSTLTINKTTAQGNNPFAAGASLLSLGDVGIVDFSIRTDSFRNIWNIVESTGQVIFADSGAAIFLAMDASTGDVIIGDQTAQFATPDGAPTFLGALDANKLHINGGIQLNGIANALSIYAADAANTAINAATFLAVNELGFSAGGGFYMNDTANIRIRNNLTLTSTGDFQAARFVDVNNTNYFADPAGDSQFNTLDIDDYIRHRGDLNTYMGFDAADGMTFVTGGTERFNLDNDSADFSVNVYAPRYYDSNNNDYFGDFASTSNMNRIDLDDFIRHRGDLDTYIGFPSNDSFEVRTGNAQRLLVNNTAVTAVNQMRSPIYYDSANINFYGDFASTSVMARITLPQNTVGVSFASNANIPDYYIGQQSGDNDGWKIFSESPGGTNTSNLIIQSEDDHDANETIRLRFKRTSTPFQTTDSLIAYFNYVEATGSFRAPTFFDSNNTAFFLDPASTSITNVMRANQFQVDGSTYIIDSPAGNYGSIRVEGAVDGTWAGYAIRDDWVFMADGPTNAGIYNDTDNKWAIQFIRNAGTDLLFNAVKQAETENGYFLATNQMRAPIYYAPSSTGNWLDLDVANTSDALRIPGRINRQNFATGNGSTNFFLTAQDRNHFIWNTATNWGIFWATDTGAAYRHVPFVDNMITFVGAGNTRAAIDLDNGNAYFQGEVSAATFAISGGNENLGLLKTYGSGLGDTMLFDATEYWEKRVILPMQGAENNATTVTAEYVKNNNGPFASSYVLRTNQYRTFDSDYIPVEPGEQIYGEIAARYISGTGSLLYMGVRRYDKDKRPIASNDGIEYFVASAVNVTSTGWTTYRGHITIPTSHTPFNGSDGGGCKYVRVIVLMNYQAAGALREFGPPVLKRANHLSNIVTQNISAEGNITATGNISASGTVTGTQFIDANNGAYLVDPTGTSVINELRVDEFIRHNGDTDTYLRFLAADDFQIVVGGRQALRMDEGADPDRLRFVTDTNWTDSNGDWNMSRDITVGRTGTAVTDFRAPIFYDSNNTGFYGDFASTSVVNQFLFTNSTPLRFNTTSTALFDHESNSTPVAFRMNKGGSTLADTSAYGVLQLSRTNHNNGATSAGAGLYFTLKDSAGTLREYAGIYGRKTVAGIGGGELVFMNYERAEQAYLNSSFFRHVADIRAPRFTDSNNTAFFVDPASTSVTNIVRANQFQIDGSTYIIDSPSGQYGSIRVDGALGGWAGYAIRDDWVFMSSGAGNAGIYNDTNNQWAILAQQQSDVQIFFNGTWEERSRSGFMEARGSYRAQIFYDTNDTNFYIDPNSQSRIVNLEATGTITAEGNEVLTRNLQTTNGNQGWDLHGNFAMQAIYGNHNVLNEGNVYNAALFKGNGWTLYGFNGSWVNLGTVPNLTNGKGKANWGGVTLPRGYTQFIIDCGTSFGYQFMSAFTLTHSTNGNTMDVYFEKSTSAIYNSGTWTIMGSATGVGSWPGGTSVKFSDVVGASYPPYVRLRIIPNFSHPSNVISLGQFFVSAAYGGANSLIGWDNNRNVTFSGSLTASSFIDSDDTTYRLDPNSTSDSAIRVRGGALHGPNPTWGAFLLVGGDGRQNYTNTSTASVCTTNGNLHLDAGSGYETYINYYDGSNVYFGNGANSITAQIAGDGTFRSPIFYDYNNTGFYGDFASTSIMNTLDIRGEVYNDGWFRNDTSGRGLYSTPHAMHWYADTNSRWRLYSTSTTAQILFTTAGDTPRGYVYADNGNSIGFLNQSGSWRARIVGGDFAQFDGSSIRAQQFFDSNNTAFYLNPNSTDISLNMDGSVRQARFNKPGLRTVASGSASTGASLAIQQETTEGWTGIFVDFEPFTGWGLWHDNPNNYFSFTSESATGSIRSFSVPSRISGNRTAYEKFRVDQNNGDIIAGRTGYANESFRAPIFYDSNNTAYYFDGASVNSTRFEGVSNRTKAMMGLPGRTGFDAEYYSARPRITGDVNYWTGAMGWGAIDFNNLAHWGSGFIDTWGNPPNQPSGTSHWVGTQAWHYTDGGNTRYGWQLVGGPIGNLRFRQSWPGFNAWRTVPMLNVNDGNVGAMYANIYYDSDNTGFYVDPTAFTNLNTGLRATDIYARSWLRNDNASTGLYNQATGTHFYSSTANEWRMTGNNDAGAINIRGLSTFQGSSRFWLHGATDGYQGFLNANGSWLFRMSHNAGLSPGIRFFEAGESWTGNVGADVGKIEYHANRFYIVSGSNSDRIVQFRRDGGDVSWIANDGVFVGTATSARWADLAERYSADAIYEAGTVLGIGGDKEVTLYQPGMPLAGAISTKPAYRMNDEDYGNDNSLKSKMNPFVALKGRIPVKINGSAKKGQWIIADKDGKGRAVDYGTPGINSFDIIGIALENGENEVEVKI